MTRTSQKQAISIRIKDDVLEWFRNHYPDGYQSGINSVLEAHVKEKQNRSLWLAGRGQELYQKYYTQCFWHLKPDLEITPQNLYLVIEGLKKFGGREGLLIAQQLKEN